MRNLRKNLSVVLVLLMLCVSSSNADADLGLAKLLIKRFEAFSQYAYRCESGVWTVGYGFVEVGSIPVTSLTVITLDEADSELDKKVAELNTKLSQHVKVPITDTQRAAILSLVYNIGIEAFLTSTLLVKLNNSDYSGAAEEFRRWVYLPNGNSSFGLLRRRLHESEYFSYGILRTWIWQQTTKLDDKLSVGKKGLRVGEIGPLSITTKFQSISFKINLVKACDKKELKAAPQDLKNLWSETKDIKKDLVEKVRQDLGN